MSVLLVCMYAYHIYSMQCLQRLEEDVWSLELKLQMVVSHLVSAGNWAQGPLHKWAVLLTTEPLLQPWYEKSLFRSVAHTLYLSLCIWYARTRARSCVWRCQASFRELGSQNWTQLARLGGRRASERQLCALKQFACAQYAHSAFWASSCLSPFSLLSQFCWAPVQ